jgi:hypothetical protein
MSFIITILVLFGLSELGCVVLIILILVILRRNSKNFSKKTYQLHFQFTILLAVQLATPLFLVVSPVALYLVVVFFMDRQSTRFISMTGYLMISLYGLTNAMFTITFVGPYRVYTYKKLIQPWWTVVSRRLRTLSLLPKQTTVASSYLHGQTAATNSSGMSRSQGV